MASMGNKIQQLLVSISAIQNNYSRHTFEYKVIYQKC